MSSNIVLGRIRKPPFFFYDSCGIRPRHWNIISHGTSSTSSPNRANSHVDDAGLRKGLVPSRVKTSPVSALPLVPTPPVRSAHSADSEVHATDPHLVEIPIEAICTTQAVALSSSLPHDASTNKADELFPWWNLLRSGSSPFSLGTIYQQQNNLMP
ncbi:hypothetical protein PVK06_042401 [Gossypium arboreum]|uniref:Uncharacterized protein n=1 Tax=Gossypium arboreum TaxID=29729 RepID=A0ABR0MKL5_GOSAR|nr:hypothetical protein PVK06_042401 [Gossypium arboreum]